MNAFQSRRDGRPVGVGPRPHRAARADPAEHADGGLPPRRGRELGGGHTAKCPKCGMDLVRKE